MSSVWPLIWLLICLVEPEKLLGSARRGLSFPMSYLLSRTRVELKQPFKDADAIPVEVDLLSRTRVELKLVTSDSIIMTAAS
jgi:hypothetical protein